MRHCLSSSELRYGADGAAWEIYQSEFLEDHSSMEWRGACRFYFRTSGRRKSRVLFEACGLLVLRSGQILSLALPTDMEAHWSNEVSSTTSSCQNPIHRVHLDGLYYVQLFSFNRQTPHNLQVGWKEKRQRHLPRHTAIRLYPMLRSLPASRQHQQDILMR